MKRFLVVAILIHATCFAPTKRPNGLRPMLFTSTSSYEPKALSSTDKMVFLAVIAASVVGFLGFQYYQSKNKPFNLYEKAKKSYDVTDPKLLNFFERYNSEKSDIAALASSIYLKPSRCLADLMLVLEAAQRELKVSSADLATALTLLDEKSFLQDCTYLKTKVVVRLGMVEELIALVHKHSLWASQYDLYVKEENERLAREARELEREHKYDYLNRSANRRGNKVKVSSKPASSTVSSAPVQHDVLQVKVDRLVDRCTDFWN